MPSLKDLNCAIELSGSQQALREFGTIYGDGFVETFVPVPNKPQSFSIHLTSNKFIAPGVAIFVYVDGVYQCNRNRQDLKLRKPSDSRSLVDFRVRQKEERQKDGSMIAREWAFDKLNIGFQYGSGPIPRDGEPYNTHPPHVGAVQPPTVDPMWLNNLLTTAVKQGVEESRRMDTQSEGQAKYKETHFDAKSASQPPGAWPESPFDAPTQPHQHIEQPVFSSRDHQSEHGSNWAKSQAGWGERPPQSRAGTHVTWNAEPALETDSSSVCEWNVREDTPSDAWDTGDTWPTDKAAEWDASSQQGKLWYSHRHPSSRPADEVTAAAPAPSVITRMTPTVMNAPPSVAPEQVQSRQPSAYANPPASVIPTPEWGAAVHEAMRKPSNVPSNTFPAPYALSMKDFVQSTAGEKLGGNRPPSLASWGNDKNDHTEKLSWGKATEKNLGWGKDTENGWQEKNLKENDKKGWYSTDEDQTAGWNDTDDNKKIQADSDWNRKDNGWGNPPSSPKQERVDKMNDWAGLKSALTSAFANPAVPAPAPAPAPEDAWPTQSWSFPADNPVQPTVQQPTPTPYASAPAPAPPETAKPNAPTHRMSNKTLSRYRPNHNFPSRIHPKPTPNFAAQPHWQFPPPPSTSTLKTPIHASSSNNTYIAPAEPRLTISKSTSSTKGIEHAVRAGKATEYGHVVGRPEYLDRLEKPYAVFRFKYRSEGVLKGLGVLGEGGVDGSGGEIEKEMEKAEKLKSVPQEELIAKMLALERKSKGKDSGEGTTGGGKERKHSKKSDEKDKEKQKSKQRRSSVKTEARGDGRVKNFTEQWVERHSRDPSVKAKSAAVKEVGWEGDNQRKSKEAVGWWGQDVNEGWGGGDVTW
ncbi:hypothetical protein J4E83_008061 [Alternaria metachromatica]|uniref:uncharacterized protein n=1 Tax=Alternaria metachromatica TaxID=283354 RepID=UPI0020C4EC03|nr:uncharacterized protein J4E83_008061 [Alternaria metachromatica]KAI4611118.1 hypothetical protein J4E83_008061 [Alternaria metachromatica]